MAVKRASMVAHFGAKTASYNRAVLKAVRTNKEMIQSLIKMDNETKKTSKGTSFLTTSLGKLTAGVAAFVLGIKKLIPALLAWSDIASHLEETQQKFNVLFRHSRSEMNTWTEDFADSVNRNATNVKKYAGILQNTFVPLGFMREEATELSKSMVKLTYDLASFNDLPTERVLTDVQSALMGNVRAVRKYGVSANETAIFQEALNQGWITEKSQIDGVVKARAINNIIIRATVDAQGDLLRTLHQTANIRRSLNDTLKTSREIAGEYINDYLTPMRKWLGKIIEGWNDAAKAKKNYDNLVAGKTFGKDPEVAITEAKKRITLAKESITTLKDTLQLTESFVRAKAQASGHVARALVLAEENLKSLEGELAFLEAINTSMKRREAQDRAKTLQDEKDKLATDAMNSALMYRANTLKDIEKALERINEEEKIALVNNQEYDAAKKKATVMQEAYIKLIKDGYYLESELLTEVMSKYNYLILNHEDLIYWLEYEERIAKKSAEAEELRLGEMIASTTALRDAKLDAIEEVRLAKEKADREEAAARETEKKSWEAFYQSLPSMAGEAIGQISALYAAMASRDMKEFTWANEKKRKARDAAYDAEKKRLENTLEDKYDLDQAIILLDKDRASEEADIQERLELEKRKMQYESAMTAWELSILSATAGAAQAIVQIWAASGHWAEKLIQTGIVGGITAASIVTISASKPVKNFRSGTDSFTVPEGYANDSFGIGLSSGERITVDTPTQQMGVSGLGAQNIYFIMDSRQVGHVVTKAIHNRDTIIRMEDIV